MTDRMDCQYVASLALYVRDGNLVFASQVPDGRLHIRLLQQYHPATPRLDRVDTSDDCQRPDTPATTGAHGRPEALP